jgi:hypothetical protein
MFLSLTLELLSIRFRTTDGSVEEVVVDVGNGLVSKQFDVTRPGFGNLYGGESFYTNIEY